MDEVIREHYRNLGRISGQSRLEKKGAAYFKWMAASRKFIKGKENKSRFTGTFEDFKQQMA